MRKRRASSAEKCDAQVGSASFSQSDTLVAACCARSTHVANGAISNSAKKYTSPSSKTSVYLFTWKEFVLIPMVTDPFGGSPWTSEKKLKKKKGGC